jgi:hypothetical protein
MKYVLILSLTLNLYFQFQQDIFESYISYHYCNGKPWESFQSGRTAILHIPYIIDTRKQGYENPVCRKQ